MALISIYIFSRQKEEFKLIPIDLYLLLPLISIPLLIHKKCKKCLFQREYPADGWVRQAADGPETSAVQRTL